MMEEKEDSLDARKWIRDSEGKKKIKVLSVIFEISLNREPKATPTVCYLIISLSPIVQSFTLPTQLSSNSTLRSYIE